MSSDILNIIYEIKKKPGLYLTTPTIGALKNFLFGWIARDPSNITNDNIINEFQIWLEEKYNLKSTQSWDRIIYFYSKDEYHALNQFYQFLDEFLETKLK